MQIRPVHAPQTRNYVHSAAVIPFVGMAVELATGIPVILPCTFMHTLTGRRIGRLVAMGTPPFVGIEPRAGSRHVIRHEGVAGLSVGMPVPRSSTYLAPAAPHR